MQSSVKMVACLRRVRSVIFHFSTSTFLRELQPAHTVATPTDVIHGQYTMWHDSSVLQFVTSCPIPMSVIFLQWDNITSFKLGQPLPNAASPTSPTFCTRSETCSPFCVNRIIGFVAQCQTKLDRRKFHAPLQCFSSWFNSSRKSPFCVNWISECPNVHIYHH